MCHKFFKPTNILNIGGWSASGKICAVAPTGCRLSAEHRSDVASGNAWGVRIRGWRHISGLMCRGWRENLLGAVNPPSQRGRRKRRERRKGAERRSVQHLGTTSRFLSLHLLWDTDWRINLCDTCIFLSAQIMCIQTLHRKKNPENLTQDLHALRLQFQVLQHYIRCAACAALGIRLSSRNTQRVNKLSPKHANHGCAASDLSSSSSSRSIIQSMFAELSGNLFYFVLQQICIQTRGGRTFMLKGHIWILKTEMWLKPIPPFRHFHYITHLNFLKLIKTHLTRRVWWLQYGSLWMFSNNKLFRFLGNKSTRSLIFKVHFFLAVNPEPHPYKLKFEKLVSYKRLSMWKKRIHKKERGKKSFEWNVY